MKTTEAGRALIESYLDAVGNLDVDAVAPMFTEDGILDLPYAPNGIPRRIAGRQAIDEFYRALPEMATPLNFTDYRIWALDEEGEFVAEYTSDSSMKASGARYRNTYVARITVRDGKIARFAEFFDPISLVEALGGTVVPPGAEDVAPEGNARMSERDAIENVLNAYSLAYDENDMEVMANCFTADAVMTLRVQNGDLVGPFEGRDTIVKLMRDSLASQTDQRRHVVSNLVVREIAGSRAVVESYLTLIRIADNGLTVVSTGRYEDALVLEGEEWRFSRRHVQLDLPY